MLEAETSIIGGPIGQEPLAEVFAAGETWISCWAVPADKMRCLPSLVVGGRRQVSSFLATMRHDLTAVVPAYFLEWDRWVAEELDTYELEPPDSVEYCSRLVVYIQPHRQSRHARRLTEEQLILVVATEVQSVDRIEADCRTSAT